MCTLKHIRHIGHTTPPMIRLPEIMMFPCKGVVALRLSGPAYTLSAGELPCGS